MVSSIRFAVAAVVAFVIAVVLAALAGIGVLLYMIVERAAAGEALAMVVVSIMFCSFAICPVAICPVVYSLPKGDRDA